jgi:hypothetical protein
VGVGCSAGVDRDEAARLDDAVEGAAVDDEVLDHREGVGAPRLDRDGLTVAEADRMCSWQVVVTSGP